MRRAGHRALAAGRPCPKMTKMREDAVRSPGGASSGVRRKELGSFRLESPEAPRIRFLIFFFSRTIRKRLQRVSRPAMTRSRILVFGARCLSGCPKPGRAALAFLAVLRAHGVMQGAEAAPQEAQRTLLLRTIVQTHVERDNYRNRRAVLPKTLNFSSAGVDYALNNSDDPWVDPDERDRDLPDGVDYSYEYWQDERRQVNYRDLLRSLLRESINFIDGEMDWNGWLLNWDLAVVVAMDRILGLDEAAEVVVEEPLEAVFFMTSHELTEVGSYFALQGPIYDSQGVENLLNVMLLERFALDGGAMPQPVVLRHFKRINRFNRRDSVDKPPRGCHVLKQLSLALARVPGDAQAQ